MDSIIHKAVIDADEKGTESAAATSITVLLESCVIREPIHVELDRPFCFLIMSGGDEVCFAGICANPLK